MKWNRHTRTLVARTLSIVALCLYVVAWPGCNKEPPGPKRADHTAAHTRRYHPDVRRSEDSATTQPEDSVPGAVTQPSDINFDADGAGCPVLFINGETLSVQEVLEPVIDDLRSKASTLSVPAYRNHLFRAVRGQIEYQISMLIIHQEAQKVFSEDKVKEAFDKEADRMVQDVINRRFGGVTARYEAHLKALDFTMEDMKARARKQAMVMQFLRERFKPQVSEPTRRELLKYYQLHPEEFTTPARAHLLLIERPLEEELGKPIAQASKEELLAAREKAREQLNLALASLKAGADFGEVARQYCKGLRGKTGGDWGEIGPGALTGRWARAGEAVFGLEPGTTSDIIESNEALFIVRCAKRTAEHKLAFEEAQEQIINRLMDEDFNRRRDEYVRNLVNKATVRRQQEFFQAVLAAAPRPAQLGAQR